MNRLARFRAWLEQSWFRFVFVGGFLAGAFWGLGTLAWWNISVWLFPHWGLRERGIDLLLIELSAGFGLTLMGTLWLWGLWHRGRMKRRTHSK
jgi:hypothetical protein